MSTIPPAEPASPGPAAATGWRRAAEIAYVVIAGIFILSVFVQFFLAGLGVFGAESFEAHKDVAGAFHLLALLLVILALLVRRNRIDLTLVIVLFILTTIQFSLPEANDGYVQSLHVLNALIIYTAAYHVLQRSIKSVRSTSL